jgi:hypothetical protein
MTGHRPLASRYLHSGISTYYAQVSLPRALGGEAAPRCLLHVWPPARARLPYEGDDIRCATSLDAQRLLTSPAAAPHGSTARNSFADFAAALRRHGAPATLIRRGLCLVVESGVASGRPVLPSADLLLYI